MADEHRIQRLLEEIMDSQCTPEEACREHPELLSEVRERWRRMRVVEEAVDAMFPTPGPRSSSRSKRAFEALGNGTTLPQIPGYSVASLIGRGGMGLVYKARHLRLNRLVAVKMLLLGSFSTPHELACLLREAEAVAGLRHTNIVQVYDVGDLDGLPYFTMEFVEGGNLAQKLGGLPVSAREAAKLVATLAGAVEVAHKGGVVHRDLKPANILLTSDGTPKIADFSLARRFKGGETLSMSGAAIGTPSYMAPEQAVGESAAFCPSVDIYALGAVLYELLTGRPPFRADSPAETQRQVIAEDPAPPSRLNARVPRDLETICLKCLQKDPGRRYATAAVLEADLHRFLGGEPIVARRIGLLGRAVKWVQRRPAQALAIGISGALVLTVLSAVLWLSAQRAAVGRAVDDDLQDVGRREAAGDWTAARGALERAKARMGDPAPASFRERLANADGDLKLVEQLGALRMSRALDVAADFSRARADVSYMELFQHAGLIAHGEPASQVASRIAASPIRSAVVAALDDWAFCTLDKGRLQWLLEIARLADPDPLWRDRVRDYRVWSDAAALTELARTARVADESVSLQLMLMGLLEQAKVDPLDYSRRVQMAHPGDFWANFLLAEILDSRNALDAIGYYRAAIAARPKAVAAYVNLANALDRQGRVADSIEYRRQAVDLAPDSPIVYHNLAITLFNADEFEPAADMCRETIRLDPAHAEAHSLMGHALLRLDRYDEALGAAQRSLSLLPSDSPQRPAVKHLLEKCRRRIDLSARLPALVAGDDQTSSAEESIEVAGMLLNKGRCAAAAAFYSAAFNAKPKLADDLITGTRYNAACAAALAGTARDKDQNRVNGADRSHWRGQALQWLRADLAAWSAILNDTGSRLRPGLTPNLEHWRADADLTPVRDASELQMLPPSERGAWGALWQDVDALIDRASREK